MLADVFGWIGEYARGVLSVLPQRRIVRSGHAGLIYGPKGGVTVCDAGWYVIWPIVNQWESFPVARQTTDVPKQPLMTKDGRVVTAGGVIRYSVDDVEKFCVENINSFEDVDDVAQIAIRDVVIEHTLDELQSNRRRIDTELRNNAQRRLESYGVKVHDLNLKGLAPAQLVHIVSDSMAPALVQPQSQGNEE